MKQIPRSEWLAIAGIVLVGAVLRMVALDGLAVEHFDEGVYASNVWFGPREDFQYPNQHLYAPPLVPFLIETIFQIFGPSNLGAMAVSLTAGCLTVPLVWWVGRRWFDPLAGLIAAALCATSSLHILLSRTCLVDALLGFWLLLAVWLITEAFERKSVLWAIAGGIATGLAWWTKYNGWLPLAITGAGLAWWWLRSGTTTKEGEAPAEPLGVGPVSNLPGDSDRLKTRPAARQEPRPPVWQLALLWGIAAVVAVAIWSPVVIGLQDKGGYAAVMTNHRQYVVGIAGWGSSFQEIVLDQASLVSYVGMILAGLLTAVSVAVTQPSRFTWNASAITCLQTGLDMLSFVVIAGITSCRADVLFVVALAGWLSAWRPGRSLSVSTTTVWLLALSLITPLYSPYPRLLLPWLVALWLVPAVELAKGMMLASTPRLRLWMVAAILVAASWFAGAFQEKFAPSDSRWHPALPDRTGIVQAAESLRDTIQPEDGLDAVVYVYAEPALLFQLHFLGLPIAQPVEHLNFARPGEPRPTVPTYVITGPHALRTAGFDQQFAAAQARLKLVKTISWQPSRVVLMDERSDAAWTPSEFRVYRVE